MLFMRRIGIKLVWMRVFFINVNKTHVCYINCFRVHPKFGVLIRLGMAKLHAILVHFDPDIAF